MTFGIKKAFNHVISVLMATMMVAHPVMAQGIVATEDGPKVIETANGTTMVMIAVPDENGVSHNTYVEFSVGPDGAIINNVTGATAETQLGGLVQGNGNLSGGAASVIINEVTTNNPSHLTGFIEVAGERADLIVANPYGITCNGCGFINTDTLTLGTGTPTYDNGVFTGMSIDGGSIDIGAKGLDASDSTRFDILSRQIAVAGAVKGQRIRVIAGRNDVIYATGEVIEKEDDGSAKPTLAIDSTVLGGMYADSITITSTEDGVGVKAPTNMAANAGAMTITADGRLVIGSASATTNVSVQSTDDVVIEGTVVAKQDVDVVSAQDLVLAANAEVVADSVATLTIARDLKLGAGSELAAGNNLVADVDGAVEVASAANFISNGAMTLDVGSVNNAGTIAATGGALKLAALNDITNSGLLFGDTDLDIRTDATILNDGGSIVSNTDILLRGRSGALATAFVNQNGGLVETIDGDIAIAALDIKNLRETPTITGDVTVDPDNLTDESCDPECFDPVKIGGDVVVTGSAAQIISSGNITLTGNNAINRYSLISASGNITINVNTLENIGMNIYRPDASDPTALNLIGAVYGTIEAAGSIVGVVDGYVQNGSVAEDAIVSGGTNIDVDDLDSSSIGNPNLLVVNVDPDAEYLVETRPDFVDLDKFISSDYFLEAVKYDPELKRFGDAYAEALYIRKQLLALLGKLLLEAGIDERAQIQAMYDNAIDAMENLDLKVGVALTPEQIASLTSDIIWMEEVIIDGQKVLAPRVYLANPEVRLASLSGSMISGNDVAFYTGDFTNSGGLTAGNGVTINASGTFRNASGQISAEDIYIDANRIIIERAGLRVLPAQRSGGSNLGHVSGALAKILADRAAEGYEDNFTERAARPSTIVAGGTLVLRATEDITMAGADIAAGTGVAMIAGGDINVGALTLASQTGRKGGKNHYRVETLLNLTSSITSGGDITLLSSGNAAGQNDIVFEGATVKAAGDIGIIAQGGDLVMAAVANIRFTDYASSKGNFIYKRTKRIQVFDLTHTQTTMIGQSITGVSAMELRLEGTKFDVPGVADGELKPGALALVSVNDNLNFTAPTDIYAKSYYRSSKILGGLISNTKDLRTLITDSLGSIADVAGDLLINSGADLVMTSVDLDIGGQFSTEVAGATYMLAAIDMDYTHLVEHRDNGIIMTDIRSEDMRERVKFNAIKAAGGIHFDHDSPIVFAGIRNPLIDSAHPGAWVANGEDGRMNILSAFLGDKDEEDEAKGEDEEDEYWRDGTEWSEEGTRKLIVASLPTATDGVEYGYIDELLARDTTVNQTIELLDYHFYEKKYALSPAFKALVSIAVGQWVGGWGVWANMSPTLAAAGKAFASSFITESFAGVVSGEYDLGKILEGAAFKGLTAGLGNYINASSFGIEFTDGAKQSLLGFGDDLTLANLVERGIDSAISAGLQSAAYGTDFKSGFIQSYGQAVAALAMADFQTYVGDIKDLHDFAEGSFEAALLHGVVGCAASAATGADCASGFVAAFGTELVAGHLGNGYVADPNASAQEQEAGRLAYEQERAAMVGAVIGYFTSSGKAANVSQGSAIATSAIANNRQLHTVEILAIREKARQLAGVDGLSEQEWLERLGREALRTVDQRWSLEFDADPVAATILKELNAIYGAEFASVYGGQVQFLQRDRFYNYSAVLVGSILTHSAFYDGVLQHWSPRSGMLGVGSRFETEYSASEVALVFALRNGALSNLAALGGSTGYGAEWIDPTDGGLTPFDGAVLSIATAEVDRMFHELTYLGMHSDFSDELRIAVHSTRLEMATIEGELVYRGVHGAIGDVFVSLAKAVDFVGRLAIGDAEKHAALQKAILAAYAVVSNPSEFPPKVVKAIEQAIIAADAAYKAGDYETAGRLMGGIQMALQGGVNGLTALPSATGSIANLLRRSSIQRLAVAKGGVNRASAWEGVDTRSRGIGSNVPDNIAGWVKGPDGSSIPILKTANGQPDWKRFLQDNAEVTSISGKVDSGSVRFTQSSISGNFSDGRSVGNLVAGLKNGTVDPASLPPIRTFEVNGQLYSLDNRRLYAYQQAGIDVPTKPATTAEIAHDTFKFTTPNGGQDIVVRGQ